MGEAIKFVLYGLFNIYNDGENSQQGCGCLTLVALIGGSLFITLMAQSDLPDMIKLIVFSILFILCLIALIWMIYQTIKQWWEEHFKDNSNDENNSNDSKLP